MAKKINLNQTVFELTNEYPELIDIMESLGFSEMANKAMRESMGKLTTIPKGAKMKKIPMEKIITALMENGFELFGEMPNIPVSEEKPANTASFGSNNRTEQIKAYLRRLGDGEDIENVRKDFVRDFSEVEASEIMKAEQELLKEGTPLEEVQRLCDVHSALFHGATKAEKIANAEKAVEESLKRQEENQADYSNKNEKAAKLAQIKGHPLHSLTKENDALTKLLEEIKNILHESGDISKVLADIRDVSFHYAKKGDLLYPQLKVKYDISGPSDVMWTVDDEIRDELAALSEETDRNEWWHTRLENVLKRIEEMIYKEQNILFPICAVNFSEDEWKGIYFDSKDYNICFGVESEVWDEAESVTPDAFSGAEGEIVMPGGHMSVEQLTAMLNTIPLEISFVDSDNINRYFNEGPKVFKRPNIAIDREVFSCHPPKIEPMVRAIIDDFWNNRRDCVPVWIEKNGRTMLVKYLAVRDRKGKYLGTLEVVQDMEFAKEHFKTE